MYFISVIASLRTKLLRRSIRRQTVTKLQAGDGFAGIDKMSAGRMDGEIAPVKRDVGPNMAATAEPIKVVISAGFSPVQKRRQA